MFGILARLLEILYSIWPSYGGSIILFTVVIMLVLAPLTFKSTRSMLAMQALQPEMKKLQNQYKDDRQKLNEEMMKFYQENKISPLGGCLPMIIQFPVFFILYAVLLGLTKRGPFGGDLGHSVACSIDGANACTSIGTYANAGFFHPAYLKHSSDLYQSLSSTRVMNSFGLDLSQSAWNVFAQGLIHALPYLIMVLVVMGLTYLQQQQIQSRQPKNADQNPTQVMMMKVMPIAMGFIYIIIPAGVVIYFLVSSVFRIGQQAMVTRTFYTGPNAMAIPTTATEVPDGPIENKSFWDRLKPSPGALPQVGKQAKRRREESLSTSTGATGETSKSSGSKPARKKSGSTEQGTSSGGPKNQSGRTNAAKKSPAGKTPAGKSPAGKSSDKPGGKPSGGTKKTRPNGTGLAEGATSKPSKAKADGSKTQNSKPKKQGSPKSSDSTDGRDKPSRTAPSRTAPSRSAPSRKASTRKRSQDPSDSGNAE